MNSKVIETVNELLAGKDKVEFNRDDESLKEIIEELPRARVKLELSQRHGIIVDVPMNREGKITIYRFGKANMVRNVTETKTVEVAKPVFGNRGSAKHSYIPPKVAGEIISILKDDMSHIIQLVGPTQCGKSILVKYISEHLGRKLYQLNCRGDMGSESFFGEKTIQIDDETKQNEIVFQKGLIEQAMTEGLDADGKEVGNPAILFIDEVTSAPAHIIHGLNRLFESDDNKRSMVIAEDGGRVVYSHSGFRIIIAGNTAGRGINTAEESMYAAQRDALDISLLNRVAATFRMGYEREIEKNIVREKVGDDRVTKLLLKFRDAIRSQIKAGKLSSPFSTKRLIDISNMYRVFKDLGKAIYYVCFEQLLPEEKPVYNEHSVAILAKDLISTYTQDDVDYY